MHKLCVLAVLLVATVSLSAAQRNRQTVSFFSPAGQQMNVMRSRAPMAGVQQGGVQGFGQFQTLQQPLGMAMNTVPGAFGGMQFLGGDVDGILMPSMLPTGGMLPGMIPANMMPSATNMIRPGTFNPAMVGGRLNSPMGMAGMSMRRIPDGTYMTAHGEVSVDGSDVSRA